MRLVDADAQLAAYDSQHEGEPGRARKLIEESPTVENAEIVVHCERCKFFENDNYCAMYDVVVSKRDFCSFGWEGKQDE